MKKTHIFCKSSALQMTYKICEYHRAFVLLVYYTTLRSKVKSHLKKQFPAFRSPAAEGFVQANIISACVSFAPALPHTWRAGAKEMALHTSKPI